MSDKKDGKGSERSGDKKSSKTKARPLTSGQLKAAAEKQAKSDKPTVVPVDNGREMTIKAWGRGKTGNPLVAAFVSLYLSQRTVKHTEAKWNDLFRKWKEQPRG